MPLARMHAALDAEVALASRLGPDVAAPAKEDLLAKKLLQWFKTEFFTWVDTLPCSRCGSTATRSGGAAQPLADERAGMAERVELHYCSACGAATRFPRYNDPGKLLQQGCRRGRCGEWANAFLLCCRAAGLTARYVSDWSDHVWTEYYSHSMRRWVHLDACEGSYDQSLLYETGWGKAVSYVVAAGSWGVTDVTKRYTSRWREVLHRRTLVPERWLARRLDEMTTMLRAEWILPKRMLWLGRDAAERMELLRSMRPTGQGGSQQPLPGRQTGSLEWRQQRGEIGSSGSRPAEATSERPPTGPATAYRLAGDGPSDLPAEFSAAGRLSGGACRARGHNETAEVVERLFDGCTTTKWLDFGGAGVGGSSWVEYRMPTDQQAVIVSDYELVSANDCPERDPAEWRLEVVTEQDFTEGRLDAWTTLDQRAGVRFPDRHTVLGFRLSMPSPPCRRMRLSITATANPSAANSVQLACWNLYGPGPDSGSSNCAGSGLLQELRDRTIAAMTAGTSEDKGSAALSLLGRMLDNIRREPLAPKFRKVRCIKLTQLLQAPLLAEVLLRFLRFRPLIAPLPAAHGAGSGNGLPNGHDVFLVLAVDATGDDVRRVSDILSALKPET
ncbi:hypothetical protein Vretimale_18777 [Volvox reticuliferus]|nr:hypothetical protein Vretifemale_19085 [Volvox reticuliferus]GIM16124.1 hypothetical protein Vretimale_18777 [Volvox reticuliferus]